MDAVHVYAVRGYFEGAVYVYARLAPVSGLRILQGLHRKIDTVLVNGVVEPGVLGLSGQVPCYSELALCFLIPLFLIVNLAQLAAGR